MARCSHHIEPPLPLGQIGANVIGQEGLIAALLHNAMKAELNPAESTSGEGQHNTSSTPIGRCGRCAQHLRKREPGRTCKLQ
jgi:hypothetical protein